MFGPIANVGDKNPKDVHDCTPLHRAAENGHLEICRLIMESVNNKNPCSRLGTTPLHRAAEYGHLEVCRLIIENVSDKNPKDYWLKSTPLHEAAAEGHLEVCCLIMENVEDINPMNNEGHTPLDLAEENQHQDIAELLKKRQY